MAPIESVWRLRGMSNLRTAGLLAALSVSLAGCSSSGHQPGLVGPTSDGGLRPGVKVSDGKVTADEASRFADLAGKRIRGADVYPPDMLKNLATRVCELVDGGLRVTDTPEVLESAYRIAPRHSGSIASFAVHTACPEASADTFPPHLWAPRKSLAVKSTDTGGKGPNHGPWLPAMLNESKYVGQDAKNVRRELEAKGYTVRVEQGRFAHIGRVTWLEQSRADPQSVVLILTWCGPADEGCPKRSRLPKDGPRSDRT